MRGDITLMKLYFYFLDTRKDNCIRMEECEVVEKKKIYKIIGNSPYGYCGRTVDKDEINRLYFTFQYYIILTEKNPRRAAEVLTCACRADIARAKNTIKGQKEIIKNVQNKIENIEKWRSENAEQ